MSNIGRIDAYLRTDTGRIRDHNEDFVKFREPKDREDEIKHGWLYLVADGVGGADAGEVASSYASQQTIKRYEENSAETDWGRRLLDAMQAANTDLRQYVAERNDNSRMATTMVAAVIREDRLYMSNVGDSRGYHYRHGAMRQITKDQSLVAKLVEEGAITAAEAENHPRKNVILYSLGSERLPKIDLFELKLEAGDMLVLCSDGLTKHVSDEEIGEIIAQQKPEEATDTLITLANERGGEDNISVAVIRYWVEETAVSPATSASTTAEADSSPESAASQRGLLWALTFFLSVTQTLLIFLAWLLLRV